MVIVMDKTQQQLLLEIEKLNKAQVRIKRKTTFMLGIIALLVLVTSTLAWFTLNSFASVENIQMDITTGVDLRVDMENHGSDIDLYKKEITNEMINSYLSSNDKDTLADQLLDPVTTKDGISFQSESGSTRTANENSYLEFECYFIASKDMWVHLSSQDSTGENEGTSVTTTETGLKADIVEAVRVSFEQGNSAAIYEPNKTTAVNGQTTFDLQTPMAYSNDTRLFHLNELEPLKVTIRLWAEGNDPQCDDDVQSANITFNLLFSGTDEDNVPFT